MGIARYWNVQTASSNVFRVAIWFYLRVLPARRGKFVIPFLYAVYLSTWIISPFQRVNQEDGIKLEVQDTPGEEVEKSPSDADGKQDVVTTPLPRKQPPHGTLSTIALSLPTTSITLKIIALIINTLLLLCAADFLTSQSREPATDVIFSRLGAVDPDGVKIIVRWPGIEGGAVRIVWRETSPATSEFDRVWKDGPLVSLKNETDWVGVGRIGGLWPSTTYEYRLAYANSTHLPYPSAPIAFRTFPDPRLTTGNRFKFIVSSCIMPNFPYLPFKGERIKGFDLLANYVWGAGDATPPSIAPMTGSSAQELPDVTVVSKLPNAEDDEKLPNNTTNTTNGTPSIQMADVASEVSVSSKASKISSENHIPLTEFVLLLGDFIYADIPWYAGGDLEAYRRLYRRMYASPSFRRVYENIPIFNIYDDHDIINNYEGRSNKSAQPFANASSAFYTYNGQANYAPTVKDEHYYEFRYGDVAFFVLDTRLHRSGHDLPEGEPKTMLGEKQLSSLYQWLDKVNTTTTFKFIVSSVPFTSLWRLDAQVDSWAGYLDERDALLTALGTVPNIFILSGDRHEFAAIEYLGGKVVEFSTSPLSMFYVPVVRTLNKRSKRLAEKLVKRVVVNKEGDEEREIIQEDVELVPEELVLKYLPLGNYKFSAIEIDTTDREQPTLKLEVIINGRTEWRHAIVGQPVTLKGSSALGTQITRGLKDALGRFGLSPAKWF